MLIQHYDIESKLIQNILSNIGNLTVDSLSLFLEHQNCLKPPVNTNIFCLETDQIFFLFNSGKAMNAWNH